MPQMPNFPNPKQPLLPVSYAFKKVFYAHNHIYHIRGFPLQIIHSVGHLVFLLEIVKTKSITRNAHQCLFPYVLDNSLMRLLDHCQSDGRKFVSLDDFNFLIYLFFVMHETGHLFKLFVLPFL